MEGILYFCIFSNMSLCSRFPASSHTFPISSISLISSVRASTSHLRSNSVRAARRIARTSSSQSNRSISSNESRDAYSSMVSKIWGSSMSIELLIILEVNFPKKRYKWVYLLDITIEPCFIYSFPMRNTPIIISGIPKIGAKYTKKLNKLYHNSMNQLIIWKII